MRPPVPTALGLKAAAFYAVLAGAFFAAPYANLYFLLLLFLTVLGTLTPLWTLRNLRGAQGEIEEPDPAPAGAGQTVTLRVSAGRRPRLGLSFEVDLEGHGTVALPWGMARGEARATGRIPPLPRGVYRVRQARLVSSWPLGFMRARVSVPAPSEIVVYPAPAALPEMRSGGGALADLCGQVGTPTGFLQPSGLREYRAGDEIRSIHWKASARRASLVVKEWDGGSGDGVEVLLDRRATSESLEESLSLIAAIALAAREEKRLLTVHSQGVSATFGRDHRPWRELLRFLAGADQLPEGGPAPPPVSPGTLRLPAAPGGRP